MKRPARTGRPTTIVVIGMFAASLAFLDVSPASGGAGLAKPPPLVEIAPCFGNDAPPSPSEAAAAPGATRLTAVVPAITWVRVRDGTPVAATTNTGCFPRATDRFFIGDSAADPRIIRAVLACTPSGDWRRPGDWVTLYERDRDHASSAEATASTT